MRARLPRNLGAASYAWFAWQATIGYGGTIWMLALPTAAISIGVARMVSIGSPASSSDQHGWKGLEHGPPTTSNASGRPAPPTVPDAAATQSGTIHSSAYTVWASRLASMCAIACKSRSFSLILSVIVTLQRAVRAAARTLAMIHCARPARHGGGSGGETDIRAPGL